MRRLSVTILFLVLTSLSAGPLVPGAGASNPVSGGATDPTTKAAVAQHITQRPCPGSIFTCVTMTVPRDHFAAPGGPTYRVTFAIHRASHGPRKGVFVTVTGGPGTSGLAAADPYTATFDPRIVEDYDLVFFDQRGIGASRPLACPTATLRFYTFPGDPSQTPAQGVAYAAAARRYAHDCVAETGLPSNQLRFFSTRQAVEDLEAFRVWLGAPKIDLYGESYGTQYVQTYAAAHPNRIRSLYLDGPVDLTLTGNQYYTEDARAFDTVLSMTLNTCSTGATCSADVIGHDALAHFDTLARQLRRAPKTYTFVTALGQSVKRTFTIGDLNSAAVGFMYNTYERLLFQRALAQASNGNLLPLARLAFIAVAQDPETLRPNPDPSWSDAMYYSVECMDYNYQPGSPAASAAKYLAAGARADLRNVRLGSVFYGDLPCAYWPAHPATARRPAPLTHTPYPVFVLASSTDPATPYAGALRIFGRLSNAYLIVQPGGPHVIFGRGNACPDDLVTAFLVDGQVPASRRTYCAWAGVDPYVPIPAQTVGGYSDALAAMSAVDDEINTSVDYWNWSGEGTLRYGCFHGGWIAYVASAAGADLELQDCAFSVGLPLSGSGVLDSANGTFSLTVTGPGTTDLAYTRDSAGVRSVYGTWLGKPASVTRQGPPTRAVRTRADRVASGR
jgi:pimeloyl-ACP methyl ester carboxylesterase